MVRTLPTATGLWHVERAAWKPFRNALDKPQRKEFDNLWHLAKKSRAEISHIMGSKPIPFQYMLMALLFQHYKFLKQLEYALKHGIMAKEGEYDPKTHELARALANMKLSSTELDVERKAQDMAAKWEINGTH